MGRLRRPYRPLQVTSVLAMVLPIARKSPLFSPSIERAGKLPIPAKIDLAESGERLHANRPKCRGPLSAGHRRIGHITTSEVSAWRKSTGSLCDRSLKARRYSIDLRAALGARSYSLQYWIHASISEGRST